MEPKSTFTGQVNQVPKLDFAEVKKRLSVFERLYQQIDLIGSWEWNLKTGEIAWSDGLYSIYGLHPGEFEPTIDAFKEYVHPDDLEYIDSKINEIISQINPVKFSFRIIRADGQRRKLNSVCEIIEFDRYNHPILMMGVNQDITESDLAQKKVKESEERYKSAQRIGGVGNWEYDLATEEFWGSDEAKRIYGLVSEEENFTTDTIENCILDREWVHQALVDLIEKEKPYNIEFEIRPIAGSEKKVIKSIAELVKNDSGTPVKVIGVVLDITDLKLIYEKMRESEEKYRQLFHSIKDSILVSDINRNIIDCNQAFREFFGYSKEEIIGRQTAFIYESEEGFMQMGRKLKKYRDLGEKQFTYIINYKKKSGEIFPGETNAFFLESDKGETVGFIGVTRDITHRKMAEESLQKTSEELERKTVELEDTNTALKVLLQKRDQDNLELQENIYSNYELMLTPFLSKLKNRLGKSNQLSLMNIIETNLQEIVAPFAKTLASPMMSLTPSEIQIATMIKQGYSNKEIATILNSSKRTIDNHRQNIRTKLKLNNEKINLKTYLLNMQNT